MFRDAEKKINMALITLSQESKELYIPKEIPEIESHSISPLIFHREYVSKNIPVIIRGGIKHWKAVDKWNIPYFRDKIGDKLVQVAVTPNGYADAIAKELPISGTSDTEYFVMPEERHMKMKDFLDKLENPEESIYYIQRQDSNFEEFTELRKDIDDDISWATETFGTSPDAINFWMGDKRAVTSMHKDPYENIYCVISGEKEFIIHPPTDLPWIPYKTYPMALYKEIKPGKWITEPTKKLDINNINDSDENDQVPWVAVNPLDPNYNRYPKYKNVTKLIAKIGKGDVFYLPSLWFHHVKQSHACVAVNYWYDMEYDIKYAYYKSLEVLCNS